MADQQTEAPHDVTPHNSAPHGAAPDSTAVRVALWRALHLEVDQPPHVLADEVGLRLAAPGGDWRARPDMDPRFTRGFRASIVARARFLEDLVAERVEQGVDQYVILGAGLDTFAQRRLEFADRLTVFEIDQPCTQAWKRDRLLDLDRHITGGGGGLPSHLRLVPVDFEAGDDWLARLSAAGFDAGRPAVVAAAGVTMYLTRDATADMLRRLASLAPGSTAALTFLLPADLLGDADRAGLETSSRGAQASGTPFVSLYAPGEILALARAAGFPDVRHVPSGTLADRYFTGRPDGLRPSTGEDLLLAST